jgi:hypothetical protein
MFISSVLAVAPPSQPESFEVADVDMIVDEWEGIPCPGGL